MRSTLTFAVVVSLLVAGCQGAPSDDDTDPTNGGGPTDPSALDPVAELPPWTIGQGWRYAVEVPGEPTRTFRMVVAEQRDDLWVVATDDRSQAIHHAVYSTNPVLGRIGRETLSPFQDGSPISMYEFPLTDGATWQSQLFGERMNLRAEFVGDIPAHRLDPSLGFADFVEGFRITAKGGSGAQVVYDYVEGVQWFTSFELEDADGKRAIKLTLLDVYKSYRGPYHFFRGQDALVETMSNEADDGLTTRSLTGDVETGFSDFVALGVIYDGRTGTPAANLSIDLQDPSDRSVWTAQFASATQVLRTVDFEGTDGPWTADLEMRGNVAADVRIVGLQTFAEGEI